jgi:hypothetical protein
VSSDGEMLGQSPRSDDGELFPDIDTLPPMNHGPTSALTFTSSSWMEDQSARRGDDNEDFPDIESLPSMNYSPPTRALLLSQNDREDMRLQSKQRAIDDIARNFRCHRRQCENDENSIHGPRLRRQQVTTFPSLSS